MEQSLATNPGSDSNQLSGQAAGSDPQQALLEQLRDIQTPELHGSAVAPAHVIALLTLLLLLTLLASWFMRRRVPQRWHEEAKRELVSIRGLLDSGKYHDVLPACSRLLRRVVLAMQHRTDVASVTGDAWLQKLDQLHGSREFTEGCGRHLLDAQYQPAGKSSIDKTEFEAVVELVEDFVRKSAKAAPRTYPRRSRQTGQA